MRKLDTNKRISAIILLSVLFMSILLGLGVWNFPSRLSTKISNRNAPISEDSENPHTSSAPWADESFEYRYELNITEPNVSYRKIWPVTYILYFTNGTCHVNSTRVYEYKGGIQTEIASQINGPIFWTENSVPTSYVQSTNISFMVNELAKGESRLYYVYYSSATNKPNRTEVYRTWTNLRVYGNDTQVSITNNRLWLEMAEGEGYKTLKYSDRNGTANFNFHSASSLSPRINLIEGGGTGTTYSPYTNGYIRDWLLVGHYSGGTDWTTFYTMNNRDIIKTDMDYAAGQVPPPGNTTGGAGYDSSKAWFEYNAATDILNLRTIFNPVGDRWVSYSMIYVYFPNDFPAVWARVGSDDGVRLFFDYERKWYNHILRGHGYDMVNLGAVSKGWHSAMVMCEENGGAWSQSLQFKTNSLNDNTDPIMNLTISLSPPPLRISVGDPVNELGIGILVNGPVYSQFIVWWEQQQDMKTWDIVTVYAGMDLYRIERRFWFADAKTNLNFTIMNSFYPQGSMNQILWDGNKAVLNPSINIVSRNYTAIRNTFGTTNWATLGLFQESFSANHLSLSWSNVSWRTRLNSGLVRMVPGDTSNLNVSGSGRNWADTKNQHFVYSAWEFLREYVGNFADPSNETQEMDAIYASIKSPLLVTNGSIEDLFFQLDLQLFDHDGNLADGLNVRLYNASNDFTIQPGVYWDRVSNVNGIATFTPLKQSYYVAVINFTAYNYPPIELKRVNITLDTSKLIEVRDLNLTRQSFSLFRVGSSEPIRGANVSFYDNKTNPGVFIGSAISDLITGTVSFRWLNYSSSDRNFSLSVEYFGASQRVNLTYVPAQDLEFYAYFHMENASSYLVDVHTIEADSALVRTSSDYIGPNALYWENNVTLTYNYTFTYGPQMGIITGASVSYVLKFGSLVLYNGSMLETGTPGLYSISLNTSNPIYGMNTETPLTFETFASKPGYKPAYASFSFTIKNIQTSLSSELAVQEIFWNDNITFYTYFRDTTYTRDIENATITYQVSGNPAINGTLSPATERGSGWYKATINSTEFVYSGPYTMVFSANKQYHATVTSLLQLNINRIRTLLNNRIFVQISDTIWVRTAKNYTFTYTDTLGNLISGAAQKIYEWENVQTNETGTGTLIDIGNGQYVLDFDTENLKIGMYTFSVQIGQTNYLDRFATVVINVVPIPIQIKYKEGLEDLLVSEVYGNPIVIEFNLIDAFESTPENQVPLSGAIVVIEYGGNNYTVEEVSPGLYRYTLNTTEYRNLISTITFQAKIYITKGNYTFDPVTITVQITPEELYGMPVVLYYLIGGTALLALVANGMYRYAKWRSIPEIVRTSMRIRNIIRKNGKFSRADKELAPSFEEILVRENKEAWSMIGLDLESILKEKGKRKDPQFPQ